MGLGASEDVVRRQLRCLEHRGPDAMGVFSSGPGSVGEARLAVVDLVTGDPPVASEQGRVGAVLNGEIYNFKELRRELLAAGHRLTTQGDTEVVAHLAESLGPVELARRLDGMFAFATWDGLRHRLVLGRDRLGKKPLYYWTNGAVLVFASEVKAVLAHPGTPCRLAPEALPTYLTFGYVPDPGTFFEGISSVPPAHVLVFEPGQPLRLERYWAPAAPGMGDVSPLELALDEAARAVRSKLSAAVQRRLVADVPVGAFLSGGVDSSSVVALMAGSLAGPVPTFTIGFNDREGFDERSYARLVARRYKTDHTELVVHPDATSLVERLVWHYDQPFGDSSALPSFLLSELARRHVTVALSGDGGDELFAGYERFAAALALERLQRLPVRLREGLGRLASGVPPAALPGRARRAQRLLGAAGLPVLEAYLSWARCVPARWQQELLADGWQRVVEGYRRVWDRSRGAELLDRLMLLNLETYLPYDLLAKVDRTSMAHGLEVRSPFLDTALVELALRLPPQAKLRGLSQKRALKLAVSDLLPPQVLHRPKRGFGVPLTRWFREDLRPYVEARLLDPGARVRAYLQPAAVDGLVGGHLSGTADHRDALWALLTLEEFLRKQGW